MMPIFPTLESIGLLLQIYSKYFTTRGFYLLTPETKHPFSTCLLHTRDSEVSKENAAFLGIICMSGLFVSLSERLYSWSPFYLSKFTAPTKTFSSSLVSLLVVSLILQHPLTHTQTPPPFTYPSSLSRPLIM